MEVTEEKKKKNIKALIHLQLNASYVHNKHNVLQAVDPDCFLLEELLTTLLFCLTLFDQLEDVTLNSKKEIKTTP